MLIFHLEYPPSSAPHRVSLFQSAAELALPIDGASLNPDDELLLEAIIKVAPRYSSNQYAPEYEPNELLISTVTRIFTDWRLIGYMKERNMIGLLMEDVCRRGTSGGFRDATLPLRLVLSTLLKDDLGHLITLLNRCRPPLLSIVAEALDRDAISTEDLHLGPTETRGWMEFAVEMAQISSLRPFVREAGFAQSLRVYHEGDKHRFLHWDNYAAAEAFWEAVKKLEDLVGTSNHRPL